MRRSWSLLSGLAVAAAVAAGCGVPDDRDPRVISEEQAPIDLDPAADQTPAGGPEEVTLYFVREGGLVSLSRAAEAETLDIAIRALLAGLTEEEAATEGGGQLVTLIPPETELRTVSESGETATINLGCTAESSETPDCGVLALQDVSQRVLFGQLVCTADAVPGISGVRLQHEGRALDAPLPDAASTAEPVRCFDYEPLFTRDRDDRSSGSSD